MCYDSGFDSLVQNIRYDAGSTGCYRTCVLTLRWLATGADLPAVHGPLGPHPPSGEGPVQACGAGAAPVRGGGAGTNWKIVSTCVSLRA
eukprot:280166-Pyramimonas_sp.AAC.1